jgi:hypothetical protein
MKEQEKKKQPTIKTLEDRGTKVDLVDFGDGRQALFFQIEKFRGLAIGAFKLGWTNKYAVVSPEALTQGTLNLMATSGSNIAASTIKPEDFVVTSFVEASTEQVTLGAKKTESKPTTEK